MKSQLLTAVALLLVAGVLLPAKAISRGEVLSVLYGPFVESLTERCKQDLESLDLETINAGYIKIFRLYYDNPEMLVKSLGNLKILKVGLEKSDDKTKVIKHHSKLICEAISSFFEVYQ